MEFRLEENLIIAKTPSEDKFAWVMSGVPMYVHRRAEATAKQAAKTRESEIDKKEKEMTGR